MTLTCRVPCAVCRVPCAVYRVAWTVRLRLHHLQLEERPKPARPQHPGCASHGTGAAAPLRTACCHHGARLAWVRDSHHQQARGAWSCLHGCGGGGWRVGLEVCADSSLAGLCRWLLQADFRRVFKYNKNSHLETKNKTVRFIGELTKFGICPLPTTFKCVARWRCARHAVHRTHGVAMPVLVAWVTAGSSTRCSWSSRLMPSRHSRHSSSPAAATSTCNRRPTIVAPLPSPYVETARS